MNINVDLIDVDFKGNRCGKTDASKKVIIISEASFYKKTLSSTYRDSCSKERQLCAHFVIDYNGCVTQLIPSTEYAHIAKIRINPYTNEYADPNENSISIHMIPSEEDGSFSELEYASLKELLKQLLSEFSLTKDNIKTIYEVTGENNPRTFQVTETFKNLRDSL